jgi:hypothetical protein
MQAGVRKEGEAPRKEARRSPNKRLKLLSVVEISRGDVRALHKRRAWGRVVRGGGGSWFVVCRGGESYARDHARTRARVSVCVCVSRRVRARV